MMRTLATIGLCLLAWTAPVHAGDEPAGPKEASTKGFPVVERDAELRTLRGRVSSARANEEMARFVLDSLRETKTEKHPKVVTARDKWKVAQQAVEDALAAYQAGRRAKGLAPTQTVPDVPAEDARLTEARVQVESVNARLRLLLDRQAVVDDQLASLRASKTERHPKVRAAAAKKAKLKIQITEVQAQLARAREHVRWLEGHRDPKTTPDAGASAQIEALRKDVKALRAEVAELKALLKEALAK